VTSVVATTPAQRALERGIERLLALQHPDGSW
jgi:hypothetical protein